ncbi:putative DEAD-box ATP-dependent RNA helicase 48 [Bidens hawaiensis]|uniref:putative DEAD-box ATP-dependent RNA helicase 48 n=1 Tax=Bidens hawaiensis TaxID=980011 RepID=UPI0040499AC5
MYTSILSGHHILHRLTTLRHMGGGPRTFPGGLNKWQWKRLHEKQARQKEQRLLDQEKQIYQARVRSEIRSAIPTSDPHLGHLNSPNFKPLSPKEHIKTLADRFVKPGAEDLWNEDDGPLSSVNSARQIGKIEVDHEPIRLQRVISGGQSNSQKSQNVGYSKLTTRRYSVYRYPGSFYNYDSVRIESNHEPIRLQGVIYGGQSNSQISQNVGYNKLTTRCYSVNRYPGNCYFYDSVISVRQIGRIDSNREPIKLQIVIFGNSQISQTGQNVGYNKLTTRHYSVNRYLGNCYYNMLNVRDYSGRASRFGYRKNESSSSEDGTDDDEGYSRLVRASDGEGSDDDEKGNERRMMMSSAALGKYDMKKTKRIPLKKLEDEDDLSLHVQAIRNEVNKKKMAEKEMETGDDDTILSPKRFDECNISPLTVQALTSAGYVQMTKVQEATISAYLEGKDALVKAKTGTGKSAAFLLPAIETVLKASVNNTAKRVPPICVLILCPTRELASQITAEANVLLKHHVGIGVQPLVGGTRFKVDQKRLETEPCHIIVATPGRLLDHIENKSGFSARLMGLQMLVLDEADHLLDLGFRKDMEKIVDCLPRKRQSLLFSATLPKEVRRVSQLVLKREHAYINTVGLGPDTHDKVNQSYVIAPHEQHFQIVNHLLKDHIFQVPNYKVIVFCTTSMMTSLMFSLLREMKMNVRELHSRKPQLYRTRVSEEFKEEKQLILITSDVLSRGMNYPDVSLVIQVGVPVDREQYINRLGRTGREGKDGEGILLLAPWEEYFLEAIKDLPLNKSPSPHLDPDTKIKIEKSMAKVDLSVKEAAYHAWLGYYNSIREIGRDKTTLVEQAKGFSETIGLEKVPALFRKTVIKMGLKDIPGIRVRK